MGKTYRHQDTYNYLNEGKTVPVKRRIKLLRYFNRVNFWDNDQKIMYRRYKDWRRGGLSRIKVKNYK